MKIFKITSKTVFCLLCATVAFVYCVCFTRRVVLLKGAPRRQWRRQHDNHSRRRPPL